MSRYLTPFKIALLKLITVYSDGMVPSSASTSILSFIVSYLLPVYPISKEPDPPQENFIFSVERLQRATVVHSSAIPGRTVWDLLLNSLWAINSLDALHAFFDDLSSLLDQSVEDGPGRTDELDLHPPKRMLLSRSSPFGTFVRRAQLEFTRLQFHDGISLWKALVLFRNPSLQFWKRRNPGAGSYAFDSNLQKDSIDVGRSLGGLIYDDLDDNTFKGVQTSIDDMEKLLDYQVSRMQRAFPQDLMGEKGLYQYALLNLAILHADFGCVSEANSALQEAIATARENHDLPCLNYSLSWFQQFWRTRPQESTDIHKKGGLGSEKEALSFLKTKAKESNMWTLLSTTLLSEAKLLLSKGESVAHAFENVVKASHLNIMKGTSEMLARKGRYHQAVSLMEQVDLETLRDLKHQQCWITSLGIIKMRRDDLDAADHVLAQLQAAPAQVQELQVNVALIEIEFHLRRRDFPHAMTLLEKLLMDLKEQEADIFQRLQVMILKARIYDRAGTPQKGFSVALRAASLAHKAQLLPVLWDAVGAICRILVSVKEFNTAVRLIESILPLALECEDCGLAALLFSCLADGHMGTAGQAKAESLLRKEKLIKASAALDRAFDEYSKIEDVRGQCEMVAKKATIMCLNGDTMLANDCAAKYLDIRKTATVNPI
ncbi:MAG: hypothetical protein LQ341_002584 [Variospora aurantia]|nr:MAG: hypothetical protein LQ341_002584 [Variospora aurantia]